MRKNFFLGFIFILLFSSSIAAADFTDAVNRQVSIPHYPQRIVSLVPSVTEILFKLGLEKRLVAVTDFCTYPIAAQKLPNVGGYADPSLESILLHKPDLVIAAADMNRPALIRRLELMKIPVYIVYPRTVEETLTTIRNIGQITGEKLAGERLANLIVSRIRKIQLQISKLRKPTTLECVMLQPLTVAGPDTFINDIIRISGGRNVVPKGPSRYPTWNTEALLTTNPETIIVSAYPGQPNPQHFFDSWPQLQAVRHKRIIRVNADWIHRPGPRMILGIEALVRGLHPGIKIDE